MSNVKWLIIVILGLGLFPAGLLAQERGSITGVVTDAATARPLAGVQVQLAGTQITAITNQDGRYLIVNAPPGEREVRAVYLGYGQASQTVTVAAGAVATADFSINAMAIALEGLIVTATGATQRRREVGSVVGNINVADVELAAVSSVAQLLTARSPGVTVISASGTTGGSQRIRIRGSNSVSLSNEPLLIIDGVRVDNNAQSNTIAVGGQTTSRLNDLNPDEIENIEILKGPAASAMYGTAAANGVIQVTTRRGRAGPPQWTVYAESGVLWDPTDYPANYGWQGTTATGTTNQCTLFRVSTGACSRVGEMFSFEPLEAVSPFRNADTFLGVDRAGTRRKVGGSVAGGTEAFTYFLAGDREAEQGIYPNNEQTRLNLRANVATQLRSNLHVALTTGWTNNESMLPQNDNNLLGQVGGALLGNAQDDETRRGYAGDTPDRIEQLIVDQGVRRFTGGLNANYQPLSWLSVVSQLGLDGVFTHDGATLPANTVRTSALNLLGSRTSNRSQLINYNLSLGLSGSYDLTEDISAQTSTGAEYQSQLLQGTFAFGRQLLPGTTRLSGTSSQFAVNEVHQDNRTLGAYLQQQVAFRDRIFLTGALRGDDNSAFGSDFGLVLYPSVAASWVIAEEPWFPQQDLVSSLRLRGAFGTSGLRPGFRNAITFFTPVGATVASTDVPAFTVGGIGDPALKPEFIREFETGMDVGFLNERAGLELTYYDKRSRDALVFRRLAPSVGAATGALGQGATGRFENIGSVSNTGWEFLVRAQPLNLPQIQWDVHGTLSLNRNKLIELGEGIEPIIFGLGANTQRHTPGYPLGGYWHRRLESWADENSDGVIQHTEVVIGEEAEFIGNPNPGREFAFGTTATFFDLVRLNVALDGKSDYVLNNSTRFFRCTSAFVNCREAFDPTAPLEDQARAIAGVTSRGVYFEDASFVKLREVALTLMAPQRWANLARAKSLSFTVAGRNLHTWTDYTGFDPEVNFAGGNNFTISDFLTQPQLRFFTTRINVTF